MLFADYLGQLLWNGLTLQINISLCHVHNCLTLFSYLILCLYFFQQMTPLFDATITNIKLASHGRLDAMNAVLISSFAASTFNVHLEAWEPLVEPFDGIFK